jgi:hypothetical protein
MHVEKINSAHCLGKTKLTFNTLLTHDFELKVELFHEKKHNREDTCLMKVSDLNDSYDKYAYEKDIHIQCSILYFNQVAITIIKLLMTR